MAQFTMPTTLMPFLYQTRTIQRVARVTVNFTRANSPSSSLRCGLHTTARRAREDIPFVLPPDIDLSRFDPEPPKEDESDVKDTITPTERQAFERMFHDIVERGQRPKLPKSTVPSTAHGELTPETSRLLAALQPDDRDGAARWKKEDMNFNVNTIIGDAAKHQRKTQPGLPGLDPLSPLASTYSAADRELALLRFPPTLRRAARMAFGMVEASPRAVTMHLDGEETKVSTDGPSEKLERTVQIEARRREERLRIKALMDACGDDFELWDVIQREVFPLVGRLGITDKPRKPATSLPSTQPRRGRRRKAQVQVQEEEQSQDSEVQPEELAELAPQAVLDMEVYGPLYPQLLFESLSMLDVKFAGPSPYATHLLPRVKSLGLVSYVLGVSTSFYNRLMAMLWHRYGDAAGVLDLLEEMRHAGLSFDENSRSLLNTIQHAYSQAGTPMVGGHFKSKLMEMPEYDPLVPRMSHWVGQVDRSIKERTVGWRLRHY